MKCSMKKIFIWIMCFSLILPSFSMTAFASELPNEALVSSVEEYEEDLTEISDITETGDTEESDEQAVEESDEQLPEESEELQPTDNTEPLPDSSEEEQAEVTEEESAETTEEESTEVAEEESTESAEEESTEVSEESAETYDEEEITETTEDSTEESIEDESEEVEDVTEEELSEETIVFNSAEPESESVEEVQSLKVDVSDRVLHAGGLLGGENSYTDSEGNSLAIEEILNDGNLASSSSNVNFLATQEEIIQDEISAILISKFYSYAEEIDLSKYNITIEQFANIFINVLNENPRFFYVSTYCYVHYNSKGIILDAEFCYLYDKSTAMSMLAEFDSALNMMTSKVSPDWSDLEKVLYINDYLAQNCEYDLTYSRYSAYDALVDKTAVCQGYAEAFQMLAQELGLPCELVTSRSLNHAWNMVKINNKYYHIDVTWNDPVEDMIGRARHYYFLKSTSLFKSEEAEHFSEDDWNVSGGWKETYASDKSYDTYFWNDIDCAFNYLNGYWYNYNGNGKIVKYRFNNSTFNQVEIIKTLPEFYCFTTGSYGDILYYSDFEGIYAIDIKDNTVRNLFILSDEQIAVGGFLYGMNVTPSGEIYYCYIPGDYDKRSVKKITDTTQNFSVYHIAFNGNGATAGNMKKLTDRIYGNTYQLPKNVFVKSGYSFNGWNTKADGSGKTYANQAEVKNLTSTNGKTVTLYAQWKKAKYKITYNLNGGTNHSDNPTGFYENSNTITFKNPTRTGYTFAGWYSDSSFKEKITGIEKGSFGDKTLYAKWIINKYNIQFDGNGATSGTMSNQTGLRYNTTYTLTANAYKRKGYSFTGWNTKADGSRTTYKNKAQVKNVTTTNGKTVILYAQWKKVKYTITYNLNGGTNGSNPSAYNVTSATITLKNPTKKGYTFAGWYSDSKFTKKVTTIPKGSTGNKTLYAKWTVNKYNVKFDGNGATGGTMKIQTGFKYNTTYSLLSNAYKRTGYVFTGWNTKKDGSGKVYTNKAQVKNLTATNGKTVTLYAQWRLPYINATSKTLYVGKTYTLKLVGTTINSVATSDSTVARVSKAGVVTAKNPGKTTITLKGANGKSYKCVVTVKE